MNLSLTEKCPIGYFGQDCKEKCPDNLSAKTTCDHVTGHFKCRPGYIGSTCEHPCLEGFFGDDCKKTCSCKNGGECSHIDGSCRCLPGCKLNQLKLIYTQKLNNCFYLYLKGLEIIVKRLVLTTHMDNLASINAIVLTVLNVVLVMDYVFAKPVTLVKNVKVRL